mmetsp:Transcript_31569/g.94827  ORF Transcript_31569/g.94827 Transcript_31569/m.94827 type:complete len:441 (-) Transcript_31569:5-1327(-)
MRERREPCRQPPQRTRRCCKTAKTRGRATRVRRRGVTSTSVSEQETRAAESFDRPHSRRRRADYAWTTRDDRNRITSASDGEARPGHLKTVSRQFSREKSKHDAAGTKYGPRRPPRRRYGREPVETARPRQDERLRDPGRQRVVDVHGQRGPRGREKSQRARDDPGLAGRRRVLVRQRHRGPERRAPRVGGGIGGPRAARPRGRGVLRRARRDALRPLCEEAVALVRQDAGGRRSVLQEVRRAAVLEPHARPVGRARRREHRDLRQVLRQDGEDRLVPRDGDRHHGRRGGRRQQRGRRPREALHDAGAGLGRLRGAVQDRPRLLHRRRVRQRPRRLQAGQRRPVAGEARQAPGLRRVQTGPRGGLETHLPRHARRQRLDGRGDRARRHQRRLQDEHRHGHAVGLLGRPPRVRAQAPPVPLPRGASFDESRRRRGRDADSP